MEIIEITVELIFYKEEGPRESFKSPHPHPHVGPQVGPTTHLNLPYPKHDLRIASLVSLSLR